MAASKWIKSARVMSTISAVSTRDLPRVIQTAGVPVHLFAHEDEVEPDAVDQLVKLAESNIAVGFVAGMPDIHLGKGVAIGGVFASDKYVCPNAVGVDIGCGIVAVPFKDLYRNNLNHQKLKTIHSLIRKRIPTGFDQHKEALEKVNVTMDEMANMHPPADFVLKNAFVSGAIRERALKQIGTLGGGNHFIEVTYDETNQIWAMLHSGSRHIGNATAEHYDGLAKRYMKNQGISAYPGLHYLEIESEEGQQYISDMLFCQQYAYENRHHMRQIMIDSINEVTGCNPEEHRSVNVHHNFCACERCRYVDSKTGLIVDKDMWVTRKGATPAREGEFGVIPGSMATGSFITRGKADPKAWNSSSHGAGRRMSRTQAMKTIDQDEFARSMDGIVWDEHESLRDEAPQAYKDLNKVMENQRSMVDIVHHLLPLVNVKGISPARRSQAAYSHRKRKP